MTFWDAATAFARRWLLPALAIAAVVYVIEQLVGSD